MILGSYNQTLDEAYEAESQAFRSAGRHDCLEEPRRSLARPDGVEAHAGGFAPSFKVRKVGVLGAGVMGAGIAQAAAYAGYDVVLKDIKPEFVEKGMATIKALFDGLVEKRKMTREEADAKSPPSRARPTTPIWPTATSSSRLWSRS